MGMHVTAAELELRQRSRAVTSTWFSPDNAGHNFALGVD